MDPTSDANDNGEDFEDCECSECHESFNACAGYEPTEDQLCDSCAQALVPDLRRVRDALMAELEQAKGAVLYHTCLGLKRQLTQLREAAEAYLADRFYDSLEAELLDRREKLIAFKALLAKLTP